MRSAPTKDYLLHDLPYAAAEWGVGGGGILRQVLEVFRDS